MNRQTDTPRAATAMPVASVLQSPNPIGDPLPGQVGDPPTPTHPQRDPQPSPDRQPPPDRQPDRGPEIPPPPAAPRRD